jgi:hypothetical protein
LDDDRFLGDMGQIIADLNDEPYQEYWHYLGKFLHSFSHMESRLLWFIRELTGANHEVTEVLFRGVRVDAAKDILNGILDATNQAPLKERLSRPLGHLAAINTVRNHLVHWGATHDGETGFLVSNANSSPPAHRLKEFKVSVADLQNMTHDINKINLTILFEQYPVGNHAVWDEYVQGPWLYTPPQLSPPKTRRQIDPQSPKRPRPASQGSRPRNRPQQP